MYTQGTPTNGHIGRDVHPGIPTREAYMEVYTHQEGSWEAILASFNHCLWSWKAILASFNHCSRIMGA